MLHHIWHMPRRTSAPRRRAFLAATSTAVVLTLVTVPTVQSVAASPKATVQTTVQAAAATAGFIDLGDDTVLGQPISINASDEVLTRNGVWHDGVFVTPTGVPGANANFPAMTMTDLDDAGRVVGYASRPTPGFSSTHAAFWNSLTTTTPSFYPAFDVDALSAACGAHFGDTYYGSDELLSVTAAGEAGGYGAYYGLPSCGGASFPITVADTASTDTHVPATLAFISELNAQYAIGKGDGVTTVTPGETLLDNRGSDTTTRTNVQVGTNHSLDSSGDVIGTDLTSLAQVEWSGGVETPFAKPSPTDQAYPQAINDAKVVVGFDFPGGTGTKETAVRWTTPGVVAPLDSDPNVPAGWHLKTAYAINQQGDITGTAISPDGNEEDYILLAKTSSVTVAMSITLPPGGLGVGDSLTVPVTVTNTGSTDLTGLSLGAGVTSAGPEATVGKAPAGASAFSLSAGTSTTLPYTIKAVQAGTITLNVSVTGNAPGGTVTAADTKTIPVSARPLTITIVTTPGKIDLAVDPKGKLVPKKVTVKVTLTNKTKSTLKNISLGSVNPVPADPTQALDQLALPKGSLPFKIKALAGGKSTAKSFSLTVTGDGDYLIRAVAIYDDLALPGGNGHAFGQGGAFSVTAPLLWFHASQRKTFVDGGSPWFVTGEVRNLSSYQTLCLPPLLPTFVGNASGLGPRQVSLAEPAPPLAGPLAPGKYLLFVQRVDSSADGSTRGSVEFKPAATLGVSGDTCNVLKTIGDPRIAASKIVVAKDSTLFFAHIDNSNPAPANGGSLEFFGALAKGSAAVVANAYEGTLVLAHEYTSVAALENGLRNLSPTNLYARCGQALASMDKALETTAEFWLNTTVAEKQAFLNQVVSDVVSKTGQVWTGAAAAIQKSATTWFDSVVNAYYSGDTTTMLKTLGGAAPGALGEVAVETAKWEIGFALLRKGAQLSGISRRVTQASKFIAKLADVPAGRILDLEEMGRLWGLAQEDVTAFENIAHEQGVVIGVRGRAPVSVERLEEGAVWKHENIKPKNVNVIDTQFLGFQARDDGLVAFRSYTQQEKTAIITKIQNSGLTKEEQQVVFSRAKTRFNESSKYLNKIEGFAQKEQIDVGFNYRENGLDIDTAPELRKFALDSERLTGGGTYYRPLQENPALDGLAESGILPKECLRQLAAVLCRVTGDMDGVYVTGPNGTALDPVKLAKVYELLAAAGWQHPETLTWIDANGKFYFGAKAKILQGLEKGGEAMVEFGPDGLARATFLDLTKSYLFGPQEFFLSVDGGYWGYSGSK